MMTLKLRASQSWIAVPLFLLSTVSFAGPVEDLESKNRELEEELCQTQSAIAELSENNEALNARAMELEGNISQVPEEVHYSVYMPTTSDGMEFQGLGLLHYCKSEVPPSMQPSVTRIQPEDLESKNRILEEELRQFQLAYAELSENYKALNARVLELERITHDFHEQAPRAPYPHADLPNPATEPVRIPNHGPRYWPKGDPKPRPPTIIVASVSRPR